MKNKIEVKDLSWHVGPLELLTVILVILKLTHTIGISWWLVFAPVWVPVLVVAGLFVFLLSLTIGDQYGSED